MRAKWWPERGELPPGLQDSVLRRAGLVRLDRERVLFQTMARPLSRTSPWAPMGTLIVTSRRVVYAKLGTYRERDREMQPIVIAMSEVSSWRLGSRWRSLYTGVWGARSLSVEMVSGERIAFSAWGAGRVGRAIDEARGMGERAGPVS